MRSNVEWRSSTEKGNPVGEREPYLAEMDRTFEVTCPSNPWQCSNRRWSLDLGSRTLPLYMLLFIKRMKQLGKYIHHNSSQNIKSWMVWVGFPNPLKLTYALAYGFNKKEGLKGIFIIHQFLLSPFTTSEAKTNRKVAQTLASHKARVGICHDLGTILVFHGT